jgi:hypothetical protein
MKKGARIEAATQTLSRITRELDMPRIAESAKRVIAKLTKAPQAKALRKPAFVAGQKSGVTFTGHPIEPQALPAEIEACPRTAA